MAILRGFPPSNTIGPGVRIAENDLSFIAPETGTAKAGIVGFASKGPIGVPTLVTTTRELHKTFGYPHPDVGDPYLVYAAEQFLTVSNQLYVVRVADESAVSDEAATTAEVDVPAAGGRVEIESNTAGDYVFSTDRFFRWRLNGVLASKTLVVLAGTYSVDELVTELNDQVVAIDGIEFYANDEDKISVRTTFSYGPDAELELVSIQDSMYGGATVGLGGTNVTGWGTNMTHAATTGSSEKYPNNIYTSDGVFDFTGLENVNLQVVIDGTDNVNIDNVVQVIDFADLEGLSNSIDDIVSEINDQIDDGTIPGGFVASKSGNQLVLTTLHYGRDAKLLVKSSSTADGIFGFDNLTKSGTSPSGVTGSVSVYTFGRVSGTENTSDNVTFTVTADSAGIEGNSTQVVVKQDVREDTFVMEVYSNGAQVESHGNLTKDDSSRFYVETYLALVSDYIRVTDNTSVSAPPLTGTYSLSGGSDGIPSDPDDQDALVIGNDVAFTGMQALSDSEQIDIDLFAVPGHSSTSVIVAGLDLCQNKRQDCFYIVDPPFGLTVNEITDWQNGRHPLNSTRFDSDFGALYWPWVLLRDTFNRVDVWCPPSGSILATIARSDQVAAPWFAPAGVNRGVVPNIKDVFSRPSLEERDQMYGYRNAINPIVQFVDIDGFLVWGNKTLQRLPTALDRVNVRRMMLYVEKRIKKDARVLLFDPHDSDTRASFVRIAKRVLLQVQQARGITDFVVQCDAELNTPDVIDRNELRARIGIQPTRAVEFIFIEFSIHRTGSFAESSEF